MLSYRKRNMQKPIRGTRTNPQNGQVITSSGNQSLDSILGGGLPLGSICLIEEDKYVTYSKVLAKYFLAEGVCSQHTVFLASLDDDSDKFLSHLPRPLDAEEVSVDDKQQEQQQQQQFGIANNFGNNLSNRVECRTSSPDAEKQQNARFIDPTDTTATPLPTVSTNEKENETNVITNEKSKQNDLRIAWRYNEMLPLVHSEQVNAKIGHHFNLMENIDEVTLSTAYTYIWPRDYHRTLNGVMTLENGDDQNINNLSDNTNVDTSPTIATNNSNNTNNTTNSSSSPITTVPSEDDDPPQDAKAVFLKRCIIGHRLKSSKPFHNPQYIDLLQDIAKMLKGDEFHIHTPTNPLKSICRICITSLGSTFWYQENDYDVDLLKFLVVLRALIRSSLAVAFVTMPMHLITKYDATLKNKIHNLVDFSIGLESFTEMEMDKPNPYKDYHGVVHLHKISAVNTLNAFTPKITDLGFKLRRKKFVIEKLHLPPEIEEKEPEGVMAQISETEISPNNKICCVEKKGKLDF